MVVSSLTAKKTMVATRATCAPSAISEVMVVYQFAHRGHLLKPKHRALTQGVEVGAVWSVVVENSDKKYVSRSTTVPEFGPKKLYTNLLLLLCPTQKISRRDPHSR